MLVLPIIHGNKMIMIELRTIAATKIRKNVCYDDAAASDIIVNKNSFKSSGYYNLRTKSAPIEFVHSKSIYRAKEYLVTTNFDANSPVYDVYMLKSIPQKTNIKGLNNLYGMVLNDLRKEVPESKKKGRYISFDEIELSNEISDSKIVTLQKIVSTYDKEEWNSELKKANVFELKEIVDYLSNFEFIAQTQSQVSETSIIETIDALSIINSKDYRNLNRLYKIAKTNTDTFTKISYISKLIYDKPITLKAAEKEKILKKERVGFQNAA